MKKLVAILAISAVILVIAGCKIAEKDDVQTNEEADYQKAMADTGTYEDCTYFLNTYPESKHHGRVNSKAMKIAQKNREKMKTNAPELSESQINQLTMDLMDKLQNNNINQVIIFLNRYNLQVPKSWVGASIKDQKDIFINKIGKQLDSGFQKFVINQANCGIPERQKIDAVTKEVSNLLDDKYSQEDAVKKLGQFEVADAFIFIEMNVDVVDKQNLDNPFLTGTCHEVEFNYKITAKLVPVKSASTIWFQNLEFKHKTYIWNSTSK